MMKLVRVFCRFLDFLIIVFPQALFVFLAVLAYASAGLIGLAPTAYSAEGVHQVHHPWAVSSSSRVQTFNDAIVAAPILAAPVAHIPHLAYY